MNKINLSFLLLLTSTILTPMVKAVDVLGKPFILSDENKANLNAKELAAFNNLKSQRQYELDQTTDPDELAVILKMLPVEKKPKFRFQQLQAIANPYTALIAEYTQHFPEDYDSWSIQQRRDELGWRAKEMRFDLCQTEIAAYTARVTLYHKLSVDEKGQQIRSKAEVVESDIKHRVVGSTDETAKPAQLAIDLSWRDRAPGDVYTREHGVDNFFNRCLALSPNYFLF